MYQIIKYFKQLKNDTEQIETLLIIAIATTLLQSVVAVIAPTNLISNTIHIGSWSMWSFYLLIILVTSE